MSTIHTPNKEQMFFIGAAHFRPKSVAFCTPFEYSFGYRFLF